MKKLDIVLAVAFSVVFWACGASRESSTSSDSIRSQLDSGCDRDGCYNANSLDGLSSADYLFMNSALMVPPDSELDSGPSDRKNFIYFDGTGEKLRKDGSIISLLYKAQRHGFKAYVKTSDWLGFNVGGVIRQITNKLCEDNIAVPKSTYYLLGFSRGAGKILQVLKKIAKNPKCSGFLVKINAVVLIDAVDLSTNDIATPSRIPQTNIPILHIKKKNQGIYQGFQPHTAVLGNAEKAQRNGTFVEHLINLSHKDIAYSKRTGKRVKSFLVKHGASRYFNPLSYTSGHVR